MRSILFMLAVLTLVFAVAASGQGIIDTKHDLSFSSASGGAKWNDASADEICVTCHTPHQTTVTAELLWNHTLSSNTSFATYTSTTMQATDKGTAVTTGSTILCMSCHDGTIAINSMGNMPNTGTYTLANGGGVVAGLITGAANLGNSLTNDHPVNFTYDATLETADGELHDPTTLPVSALLDPAGKVQCSSCHDPHSSVNPTFMRVDNTGRSALCTTCHIK